MKMKQPDLFGAVPGEKIDSGAVFSEDRQHRYMLWRIWNKDLPLVMFIGLNPSTANETQPDPTITRVKDFAEKWGYGGFYMMNLFSYVTAYPGLLWEQVDKCHETDKYFDQVAPLCEEVIFAWGTFKEAFVRSRFIIARFPDAKALAINVDGSPRHPLYVRGDTIPIRFKE